MWDPRVDFRLWANGDETVAAMPFLEASLEVPVNLFHMLDVNTEVNTSEGHDSHSHPIMARLCAYAAHQRRERRT